MGYSLPTPNMFEKLRVPSVQLRWADAVGATLEPAEGQKSIGHVAGTKPPARWMNWIQNLISGWLKHIGALAIGNWFLGDTMTAAGSPRAHIYHPDLELWMVVNSTNPGVTYSTPTGHNWAATGGSIVGVATLRGMGIDSSYFLIAGGNGNLYYSATGATWTQITAATIGGTGALWALCTKYPSSDYTIVVYDNCVPRRAASGIAGAWTGATTPPTVRAWCRGIVYLGSNSWALLGTDSGGANALLSVSSDDGDTWADSATDPVSTSEFSHIAYCPDTGRIVIVGADSSGDPTIEYTDDLGTTWTVVSPANLADHTLTGGELRTVYCCGGGYWVAAGVTSTGYASRPNILVSKDNGTTWDLADLSALPAAWTASFVSAACDGRKLILGNGDPDAVVSQTVV